MHHFHKDELLSAAKDHIGQVRKKIQELLPQFAKQRAEIEAKFYRLSAEDQYVAHNALKTLAQKTQDLGLLYPAPYFIKCIVKFDTETADRIFYFSKLPFAEENIYSWTVPAAALRFKEPGKFSYLGPGRKEVTGTLSHKEQYLITDGNIVFMAAEAVGTARELIYQEHFTKHKTEFVLPEIVEQMEAAQDKAIRTPSTRNLLISGPAGSGKTTLALHRIAYLLQAPDTSAKFSAEKTLVLVNDYSTRKYFASLLPSLGISNVAITTFADFVLDKLSLHNYTYTDHRMLDSATKYLYEHQKHTSKDKPPLPYRGDIFEILRTQYAPNITAKTLPLLKQQEQQKMLDRFDLTLLLESYLRTFGKLTRKETEFKQLKGGRVSRTTKHVPLNYSLVLLDEVQNYLPQQIELLKLSLGAQPSMIYVGDLAQQTRLFTVRAWTQVNEMFAEDNTVSLQKVYRSTKQILQYIQSQGFAIQVPENARDGKEVSAYQYTTTEERQAYIKSVIEAHQEVTIGVLVPDTETLDELRSNLGNENNRLKILTVAEAQGVEFDVVVLCDSNELIRTNTSAYPEGLASQVNQVNRDLLYVALTRAMNELHILNAMPNI